MIAYIDIIDLDRDYNFSLSKFKKNSNGSYNLQFKKMWIEKKDILISKNTIQEGGIIVNNLKSDKIDEVIDGFIGFFDNNQESDLVKFQVNNPKIYEINIKGIYIDNIDKFIDVVNHNGILFFGFYFVEFWRNDAINKVNYNENIHIDLTKSVNYNLMWVDDDNKFNPQILNNFKAS